MRRPEIDRLKGLLIALVVLGHNSLFSEITPRGFNELYNFHVASFLLIPFLYEATAFSRSRLRDRFVRYIVPHAVFLAISCAVYFLLFIPKQSAEILRWLVSVGMAVVFSSESMYNEVSGFRLFWFLPALWVLVSILTAYYAVERKGKIAILLVAVCVHLFLGLVPMSVLPYVPWGLPIVLFVFPLGLLAGELWRRYDGTSVWLYIFGAAFIICLYLSWVMNSFVGLAGEPQVYSILDPGQLLFHDLLLLSALFGLLGISNRLPDLLFRKLGAASLFLYLAHGLVWQFLLRTGLLDWAKSSFGVNLGTVLGTYIVTLGVCLILYDVLKARGTIWSFVFPRSADSWQGLRLGAMWSRR